MKVLFISSGNSGKISPIVKSQGESLKSRGVQIDYFLIEGKGFRGYLKNISKLRQYIARSQFDLVHAHYSLSGFVTTFSGANRVIVSLMGSDLEINRFFTSVTRFLAKYVWIHTIVKSDEMVKKLNVNRKKCSVLPNGVDVEKFKPMKQDWCKTQLNWQNEGYQILFAANPARPVKNFTLFKKAISVLKQKGVNIHDHTLCNITHEQIPIYMNAADVVCLSSKREGSPNVIKEAVACNRPIVSTRVGDVIWIFGGSEGNFVSDFNVSEYADQLEKAISFSKEYNYTNGRKSILGKGLDSLSISNKLLKIYKEAIQ